MYTFRILLTGALVFSLSGLCKAQETQTQDSDSAKNTIIITSVVLGGAAVLLGGYWIAGKIKAKNASADSAIANMKTDFDNATSSWKNQEYDMALDGFSSFSTEYRTADNRRIKKKLKSYFDISQNAISIIPLQKDTLSFVQARKVDNVQSYQEYLSNYPSGIYKEEADRLLREKRAESLEREKELYLKANSERSLSAYREYAQQYPEGKKIQEVKAVIDKLEAMAADSTLFSSALVKNTISAYQHYVATYPAGQYVPEAKDSISNHADRRLKREAALYKDAKAQRTIESYYAYVNEFPDGEHIDEISSSLKDLEAKEAREQEKSARMDELIYEICAGRATIGQLQSIIDQENRVGERTGYVDVNLIQKETKAIIFYEDRIKALTAEYRSLCGKSFSNNLCTKDVLERGPRKTYYRRFQQGPRIERGK